MQQVSRAITVSAALLLLASIAGAQGAKPLTKCAVDAVMSGTVCMDKYEASVWRVSDPTGANKGLVKKIKGKRRLRGLEEGGATQLGIGTRRLRAVRGQRAELHRRHLRGEPAGGEAVGDHHVVPGAGGLRKRPQAAAVEDGVAGRSSGHARPGAGRRRDELQYGQRVGCGSCGKRQYKAERPIS